MNNNEDKAEKGTYYLILGIRFYPKNLLKKGSGSVLVDLLMLLLVLINITLFVFWWVYGYYRIQQFFIEQLPGLHEVLFPVYQEFPLIDLIFVLVFLGEFFIRWGVAIYRQTYHRWFFFPFVYWYDLLGAIPFGSFRFLRILRVFALVNRLQRMGVLDLRQTYLFSRIRKYRGIVVEEISDRVVINVIKGMQRELHKGMPLADRITQEVIQPYKPTLVEWLSHRLQKVTAEGYKHYKDDLQQYVDANIQKAVTQNEEIKQIGQIPVLGPQMAQRLERAIQDIVFQVVNNILQDMAGQNHNRLLDEISDIALNTVLREDQKAENEALDTIVSDMVVNALEVIKQQVKVKEWKIKEELEEEDIGWAGHAIMDPDLDEAPKEKGAQPRKKAPYP